MKISTIQIQQLKKYFIQGNQEIAVIDGIDATFSSGKTYAITGPSGSGKSTFLHLLAGIDEPSSGTIYFDDLELYSLNQTEKMSLLNSSLGLVFQLPYLIAELSVVENVMVPGMIAHKKQDECKERAIELLKAVGLEDKIDSAPSTLSGGQQQRVALARALFNKPAFLLADEPTGNLDPATGKQIVDLLISCNQEWGMGLIISSHDAYVAQKMEQCYELQNGQLNRKI